MRFALVVVVALVCTSACKNKQESAPAAGSGSSAQAPSVAAAAPVDAASGLVFEAEGDPAPVGVAFGKTVPKLPAVSRDGGSIATIDWLGIGEPADPPPIQLAISELPSGDEIENLPLLDEGEATEGENWVTPELQKRLEQRGAAAVKRLQGFRSLVKLDLAEDSKGEPQPTKIGDLTLVPTVDDDSNLVLALNDASGATLYRDEVAASSSGDCTYRPWLDALYRDPDKPALYAEIRFHYREDCDKLRASYLVWNIDADARGLRKVVTSQLDIIGINTEEPDELFTDDVLFTSANFVAGSDELKLIGVATKSMDYSGHKDKDVAITISRDGKSAWASELATVTLLEPNTPGKDNPWRVSSVLVKTPKGWRIGAAAWTEPRRNADANRAAKSGKLTAQKLDGDSDPTLRAAFEKLTTEGVDANAVARNDLIAIGSGPGERTVGGAGFAKAWNAAWKGKVTIVSTVAHAMPSGTTGWVTATIELAKTGYKIPFTVFCIFDKAADGTWSLVHIHFAV
ncbi:MAG: hypothetical protein HOV81_21025 [Kofleriaceae bacterium]|nr:hypothetical protein [Kofleriaceae bacterium]